MTNRSCTGSVNASIPLSSVTPSQCPIELAGAPLLSERVLEIPKEVTQQGTEAPSPFGQAKVQNRKTTRAFSNVWMQYNRVNNDAFCKYCGKSYKANNSKYGTTNLIRHARDYMNNPNREVDKKQKTINVGKKSKDDPNVVSMKLVEFNQGRILIALAKIILDEISLKFVENEGFRKFMEEAEPYFKIPSRSIIARCCIQVFNDEKKKLKCVFSANK